MKSALVMLDPEGAEFCEGTFVQRLHKIISTNFHVSSFVKNQFRTSSSLQHLKGNLVFFFYHFFSQKRSAPNSRKALSCFFFFTYLRLKEFCTNMTQVYVDRCASYSPNTGTGPTPRSTNKQYQVIGPATKWAALHKHNNQQMST